MRSEFLPEMRLQGSRAWLTTKDKAFLGEDASPGRKRTARIVVSSAAVIRRISFAMQL